MTSDSVPPMPVLGKMSRGPAASAPTYPPGMSPQLQTEVLAWRVVTTVLDQLDPATQRLMLRALGDRYGDGS